MADKEEKDTSWSIKADKKKSKVKVGDTNNEGFKVLEVLEDGRLLVSSREEAKVIKDSDF
jgi:hypothetical protein